MENITNFCSIAFSETAKPNYARGACIITLYRKIDKRVANQILMNT